MNRHQLIHQINQKQNYLCVGLDTDLNKIPKHLLSADDPVFEFNKAKKGAMNNMIVSVLDVFKFLICSASNPMLAFSFMHKFQQTVAS